MTDNGPATAMPETSQVFDLATAVRDCIIALKDATERSIERLDAVISNLEGQQ